MKRALTVAAVGALLVFSAPGAAFGADPLPAADHRTADHPGDHGAPEPDAGHKDGATAPEATGEPEQAPPAHPYGDREQHDDEEGTVLF